MHLGRKFRREMSSMFCYKHCGLRVHYAEKNSIGRPLFLSFYNFIEFFKKKIENKLDHLCIMILDLITYYYLRVRAQLLIELVFSVKVNTFHLRLFINMITVCLVQLLSVAHLNISKSNRAN